jgi:WD40 repeat protein
MRRRQSMTDSPEQRGPVDNLEETASYTVPDEPHQYASGRGIAQAFGEGAIATVNQYGPNVDELIDKLAAREKHKPHTVMHPFATVPILPPNFIPRPEITQPLIESVLSTSGTVAVTAIEGMGGVGKTMVANELCHNPRIRAAFPGGILWFPVGKQSGLTAESLTRKMAAELKEDLETYSAAAYRSLFVGKSVLVVLDDVWTLDAIEPFLLDEGGSRLIYTTRVREIAASLGAVNHDVGFLDDLQARTLLARWSGRTGDQPLPEPHATAIITECRGLVLGLAMIGAALKNKPVGDWERIVRNLREVCPKDFGSKVVNYAYHSLYPSISASVEWLSQRDKTRYLQLAVLLEDMPAPAVLLQQIWGDDRDETEALMSRLVDVCLANSDAEGSLRLHDFQLDFIRAKHPDPTALAAQHWALLRSIHVVQPQPKEFAFQMIARLLPHSGSSTIAAFIEGLDAYESRPRLRALRHGLEVAGGPAIRLLEGHTDSVTSVVVTANGQLAVSGSKDRTLRVWNLVTHQQPRVLQGHAFAIKAVAVTPDGRLALSGSEDGVLCVWDLRRNQAPRVLQSKIVRLGAVALTPDGRLALCWSEDGTLHLWDLNGKPGTRVLKSGALRVNTVAVKDDGSSAFSISSEGNLWVWNLESDQNPQVIGLNTVTSYRSDDLLPEGELGVVVAVTSDGKSVIRGSRRNGNLLVWDLEGIRPSSRVLKGRGGGVTSIALTSDARLAISASEDNNLWLWNLRTNQPTHVLRGHTREVNSIAVTPDGRLAVSGSTDHTLRVWSLEDHRLDRLPKSYANSVDRVAVTGDARLAVSNSRDNKLRIWDLIEDHPPRVLEDHRRWIMAVAVTPDGRFAVSGSEDKSVRIWDLTLDRPPRVLARHRHWVQAVAVTPDARLVISGSEDRTLIVWDLVREERSRVLEGHSAAVMAVAVTPNGGLAISGSEDKTLRVWDLVGTKEPRVLEGHTDCVTSVAMAGDGRLAISGSRDHTLRIWDLKADDEPWILRGHTGEVTSVALTSDGRRAFSSSKDKTLRIWDVEKGKCMTTLTCDAYVTCCSLSTCHLVTVDNWVNVSVFRWDD